MRRVALLTSAGAAALTPGAAPGVGLAIVALLAVATAVLRRRPTFDLVVFGGLAALLGLAPVLRDSGSLVALDLLAAFVLLTVALCGPSLLAPFRPIAAIPNLGSVAPRPGGAAVGVGRGVALAVAVVVPFAALFWSADAAFARILGETPFPEGASLPLRLVAFAGVLGGVLAVRLAPEATIAFEPVGLRRRLAPVEWIPGLAGLVVLFAAFVGIQATVLFGGRDHVLATSGLTYAEYARSGYWQLLAVSGLTFAVVGLAVTLTEAPTPRLARLRRGLLAALILLTLVILASAFHRVRVYEAALGATPLRLYVQASLVWLGLMFVLVLGAGVHPRVRAQVRRLALTTTALGLVAFTLLNPDARVAEQNVDRWHTTGKIDLATLAGLSTDAAGTLQELPARFRAATLGSILERTEPDGALGWNLSRSRARALLRP